MQYNKIKLILPVFFAFTLLFTSSASATTQLFSGQSAGYINNSTTPKELYTKANEGTFAQSTSVSSSNMLLHVNSANPRYFYNENNEPVYLTGSHWGYELQDYAFGEKMYYSFSELLDEFDRHGFNFMRMWVVEDALNKKDYDQGSRQLASPMPFVRLQPGESGYALANDGGGKYDFYDDAGNVQFNDEYFSRLRTRVVAAGERDIYVSVMLFQGVSLWGTDRAFGGTAFNHWFGHYFNSANNVNGINGDINGDGTGYEVHELASDYSGSNKAMMTKINDIQIAYIHKVIDTVGDLDNVLYEISNEDGGSKEWQYAMINEIKKYEATKQKQHPVGMTFRVNSDGTRGSNTELINSNADWISPRYSESNPDVWNYNKVSIADSDHINWDTTDPKFAWTGFFRGHNMIILDGGLDGYINPNDPDWLPLRQALGYVKDWAGRIDLKTMIPQPSSARYPASTKYALYQSGAKYLVFQPGSGSFYVYLEPGRYSVEWFNPLTGTSSSGSDVSISTAKNKYFSPPFSGMAVLYLNSATTVTHTLSVNTTGSGTVTGAGTYNEGTQVTLTATPSSGYTFSNWSGACSGTSNTCIVTMSSDKTVTATFEQGVVIPPNDEITLVDVPKDLIVGQTYSMTINYKAKQTNYLSFSLKSASNNSRFYYSTPNVDVPQGEGSKTFTFQVPAKDTTETRDITTESLLYYVVMSPDGTWANRADDYVLRGVNAEPSGDVVTQYILSVNKTGSGTVTGAGTYNEGTQVTLTATPSSGYTFSNWSGACSGTSNTCTVTMSSDRTVSAEFRQIGIPDSRTFYIDYENGNDSNSGTSKTSAWKRAPAMQPFNGSYSHQSGDHFIFKGGVTWPNAAIPLRIEKGGTAGDYDYYGVDKTWYKGSTWAKPVFDAESKAFVNHTNNRENMVRISAPYVTFEGIEIKNYIWTNPVPTSETEGFGVFINSTHDVLIKDVYVHDWVVRAYVDSKFGGVGQYNSDETTLEDSLIVGPSYIDPEYINDSGIPGKSFTSGAGTYSIEHVLNNEITGVTQGIWVGRDVGGNYVHNTGNSFYYATHENGAWIQNDADFYNNVMADIYEGVGTYFLPGWGNRSSRTMRIWGNVFRDTPQIDLSTQSNPDKTNTLWFFNNVVKQGGYNLKIGTTKSGAPFKDLRVQNNVFISDYKYSKPDQVIRIEDQDDLANSIIDNNQIWTINEAANLGMTESNLFAPTRGIPELVDKGVSSFNGLSLYRVPTNFDRKGTARPQGSAWDIGAYEWNGTVNPGTTHTLTVNPVIGGTVTGAGTYNEGTTATLTATPSSGYIFSGWSGACSGDLPVCTVTMSSDKTVTAQFVLEGSTDNYAPTDILSLNTSVAENWAIHSSVSLLLVLDPDLNSIRGDSHDIELVSGVGDDDNGHFSIKQFITDDGRKFNVLQINISPDFENPVDANNDNTYNFRVKATDEGGLSIEKALTLIVTDVKGSTDPNDSGNILPVANGGSDQTITLPTNSVSLTGVVTDTDIKSAVWSKQSGPGVVTFTVPTVSTIPSQTTVNTTATFSTAGTYVLKLTGIDNAGNIGTDTVTVTVSPEVVNPPSTTNKIVSVDAPKDLIVGQTYSMTINYKAKKEITLSFSLKSSSNNSRFYYSTPNVDVPQGEGSKTLTFQVPAKDTTGAKDITTESLLYYVVMSPDGTWANRADDSVLRGVDATSGTVIGQEYALSVNKTGSGTVTGAGTYNEGTQVTLKATPSSGYTFSNWNGACSGTSNTCTVTMSSDKTVSATFEQVVVLPTKDSVSFVSSPNPIYRGQAVTVKVNYQAKTARDIKVSLQRSTGETFVTGQTNVSAGEGVANVTFTVPTNTPLESLRYKIYITPDGGYWSNRLDDDTEFGINVRTDVPVIQTPEYNLSTSVSGSGSVTGAGTYNEGATATLTATPSSGYTFSNWSGACSGTSNTCTVTMSSNKTVTATFEQVVVLPTKDEITSVDGPNQISNGTTANVLVKYKATQARDILVEVQKTDGSAKYVTGRATVQAGEGAVIVPVAVSGIPSGERFRYYAYMTTQGGYWSNKTSSAKAEFGVDLVAMSSDASSYYSNQNEVYLDTKSIQEALLFRALMNVLSK